MFLIIPFTSFTQEITGPELLKKTIDYHDPQGNWPYLWAELELAQTRPNGGGRASQVTFKNDMGFFQIIDNTDDGHTIVKSVYVDSCDVTFDGSREFSAEFEEKYRLSDDRVRRTRNYYLYLYGLPMKLTDPGTNVIEEVKTVEFNGKEYFELQVTYDQTVGSDDWFFYIDPKTYAMEGYRFHQADGDGEYILLKDIVTIEKIKIPKMREWYITSDSTFLGADNVAGFKILH